MRDPDFEPVTEREFETLREGVISTECDGVVRAEAERVVVVEGLLERLGAADTEGEGNKVTDGDAVGDVESDSEAVAVGEPRVHVRDGVGTIDCEGVTITDNDCVEVIDKVGDRLGVDVAEFDAVELEEKVPERDADHVGDADGVCESECEAEADWVRVCDMRVRLLVGDLLQVPDFELLLDIECDTERLSDGDREDVREVENDIDRVLVTVGVCDKLLLALKLTECDPVLVRVSECEAEVDWVRVCDMCVRLFVGDLLQVPDFELLLDIECDNERLDDSGRESDKVEVGVEDRELDFVIVADGDAVGEVESDSEAVAVGEPRVHVRDGVGTIDCEGVTITDNDCVAVIDKVGDRLGVDVAEFDNVFVIEPRVFV